MVVFLLPYAIVDNTLAIIINMLFNPCHVQIPNNIKIIPKLYVDGTVLNYIVISFDNFIENKTNPEFRDNIIEFDIARFSFTVSFSPTIFAI